MNKLDEGSAEQISIAVSPLRQLRRGMGLSLEAVGCLAGCDAATVSRLERGLVDPKKSTIVNVARALGISVSRLQHLLEDRERVR